MATTLTTPTSQLQVDATAAGPGDKATISNLTLTLQPGGARLATVSLLVTPSGQPQMQTITLTFLFSDQAFDEFNIYGGPKSDQRAL